VAQIPRLTKEFMKNSALLLKIMAVMCGVGLLCAAFLVLIGSMVFNKTPQSFRAIGALTFEFGLKIAATSQQQSAIAEMARGVIEEIQRLPDIATAEVTRSTESWVKIRVVVTDPHPSYAAVGAIVERCTPDANVERPGVLCEVFTEQGTPLSEAGQPIPEVEQSS
jgi:hypothetical protein